MITKTTWSIIKMYFPVFSCIFLYLPVFTFIYLYLPVFTCIYLPIFACICLYLPVFACICLYLPVFSCIYLYLPVFPYICLYLPVFACIFRYLPVFAFIYLYLPVFPCICLYLLVFICLYLPAFACICLHLPAFACICLYLPVFTCICLYLFVFACNLKTKIVAFVKDWNAEKKYWGRAEYRRENYQGWTNIMMNFRKKKTLIRIDVYSVLRIQLFSATSDGTKYNYAFWKKNGKSFKGQFKVTLSAISAISHQNYSGNIPTHLFFTLDTLKFSRVFFY